MTCVRVSLRNRNTFPIMYNIALGGISELIQCVVQSGETIDAALKRFNQKVQLSGVLRDLKDHSHYVKPSEKRRRAKRRPKRF